MTIYKKSILLCLFFIFMCCFEVQAKNPAEYIRYLVEQTSADEVAQNKLLRIVQGKQPVYFNFSADKKICKEKYGIEAMEICGRSFQDILPDTEQIHLTPKMNGKWQWQSDSSLAFYPEREWMPNTKFSVQFGKESLPKLTVITKQVQFTTQPLKPVLSAEFKFDPEDPQKMVLAGTVSFNYQVSADSIVSKLHIVPQKTGAVSLGSMKTNFHANTLYFSVPVLKVNDKAENVKIQLVSGVQAISGGKTVSHYDYMVKIPARSEIFKLVGYESSIEELPDMSVKQNIIAEFSLPVLPKSLQNNIEAVLLPREKVLTEHTKKNPPYTWWSLAEITPDVLKKSEPLSLTVLNTGEANRFVTIAPNNDIEAGRCAYIVIKAPVKGPENFILQKDSVLLVQFKPLNSAVKFLQKGSLLSLHGDKKLSLYARNAEKIDYTVRQIRPEFINTYVQLLKNSHYRKISENTLDPLSIIYKGSIPLALENAEKAQFASLDLQQYLQDNKGLFHVTLEAKKDDKRVAVDSRFIMLTDIGMILKADEYEENSVAYLVSLSEGEPISDATLEVVGANGIALFTGRSDKNGMVRLPSLKGFEREKEVVAITASYKGDLTVLPYMDYDLVLRPHNTLDTRGKVFSKESINGFVFSQRDLYRTGETAHFGFIFRQGDFKTAGLENVPLTGIVYASNGQIISKGKITVSELGMGEYSCVIPENAVSGMYTFYVEKADSSTLAAKDFHVMDFVPDTVRVMMTSSLEDLAGQSKKWYNKNELKEFAYTITAENLFGTPAVNAAVKVKLHFSPLEVHFDNEYKKFKFYDPAKLDKSSSQDFGTYHTDDTGNAIIAVNNSILSDTSFKLTMQAEVQDEQGSSPVFVKNILTVSPATAMMGYFSQSNLSFLTQNEKAILELVALNALGKKRSLGELSAELYQSELVKSLINVNGEYKYTKVRREKLLSKQAVMLPAEKTKFVLDTSTIGDKLLVFKDNNAKVVLQVRYTVVGDSKVQFEELQSADLQVHIENREYKQGESMKVAIKAPYKGTGLITLEREKVYTQKWFNANHGDLVEDIEIPVGLEGKAYLNVIYFRNIDDEAISVEPCASVVLPFVTDVTKRNLDMQLTIAQGQKNYIARPGEEVPLHVQASEKAKVIVYAVDEGIIQLTAYQKPNPVKEFFLDRALSVQTNQYLDMLMPEFGLIQKRLAKFGGDMISAKMANAMREGASNPFKVKNQEATVFWSGMLDVDENGTDVRIPIPDTFNGTLRIYAVACSETKMNAVQQDILCQAEIVIQPQYPLFVTPGDEFEVSVLLTDMRKSSQNGQAGKASNLNVDNTLQKNMPVELTVDFDDSFELVSENIPEISFDKAKQDSIRLRFKVKDGGAVLGEHTIRFFVQEKERALLASMPVQISIRPASSLYTVTKLGRLQDKNGSFAEHIELQRKVYPQFATLTATVSPAPLPYVQAVLLRMGDIYYPDTVYAVAKTMPLLYLLQNKEYAPQTLKFSEEQLRQDIQECLVLLQSRFNHQSAFYRWDSYGRLSLYELSFILDFVSSAKEQGIFVDSYFYNNLLGRMEQLLSVMPETLEEARSMAYGAWCLTRNGIITSQIMANLTTWLEHNHKGWEKDIVASLMAGSMKLMMQDELALMLVAKYQPMEKGYKVYDGFNILSDRALYLSVLAKAFPNMLSAQRTQDIIQELLNLLQEYHSVSSESLAISAVMAYAQVYDSKEKQNMQNVQAVVDVVDRSGNTIAGKAEQNTNCYSVISENNTGISDIASVAIQADKPLYYHVSFTGYDRERFSTKSDTQAFSVTREFRDTNGNLLNTFSFGEEIVVVIKARSLTGKAEQVLITDILASAFEFVQTKAGSVESFRTQQGRSTQDVLQEETEMQVEFADRQQDRAILFATLTGEESVFRYKVRIGNKGSFIVPDISVQSVADPLLAGRDLSINDSKIIVE